VIFPVGNGLIRSVEFTFDNQMYNGTHECVPYKKYQENDTDIGLGVKQLRKYLTN